MKGAIACFVAATLATTCKANGGLKRGSLSFLITGDEETVRASTARRKVLDWMKARGESARCLPGRRAARARRRVGDEIKIGRRGYVNAELIVHGKQGHSAYGELADNPIPKLARMLDRLSSTPLDKGTRASSPRTCRPTVISVPNSTTNVIPARPTPTSTSATTTCTRAPKIEAWIREQCESGGREWMRASP